jgi:hypothetical protein
MRIADYYRSDHNFIWNTYCHPTFADVRKALYKAYILLQSPDENHINLGQMDQIKLPSPRRN